MSKKGFVSEKVPVSVRLYPNEKKKLAEIALEEDQSMDRLARFMIRDGIRRKRPEAKLEDKAAA
jgi:hypothetical protein